MIKCESLAVVRDENGEAIRDVVTQKPLMRECRNYSISGLTPPRCIMHCSLPDKIRIKQEAFLQKRGTSVAKLLVELDIPDQHPMDGLLEAVRLSGNMMRMFQVLTSELEENPLVETVINPETDTSKEVASPGVWNLDHNGDQVPHVFMSLLQTWTERYMRACKLALDAGLDERLVRNAEMTSGVFLMAFERALKSIDISDEQKIALSQSMAQEVRTAISAPNLQLETST